MFARRNEDEQRVGRERANERVGDEDHQDDASKAEMLEDEGCDRVELFAEMDNESACQSSECDETDRQSDQVAPNQRLEIGKAGIGTVRLVARRLGAIGLVVGCGLWRSSPLVFRVQRCCPSTVLVATLPAVFKVSPLPRTLQAAKRDLASEQVSVRRDAVADLGHQREAASRSERVELLVSALRDPAPSVRRQAAVALADLEASEATGALVELLADPELAVRQMVVMAVGELASTEDEETLGRLAGLLHAGAAAIRFQALSATARLLGEQAASAILDASYDEDEEVRELSLRLADEVVLAARPHHEEARRTLATLAVDPAPSVRAVAQVLAAEWGIEAPREAIIALVSGRQRAREARDEQLAIELCGRLRLVEAKSALRQRAFGFLGYSLDPFRWSARVALARMGDFRAISQIEKGLGSRSALERTWAVKSAGEAGLVSLTERLRRLQEKETAVDQEILSEALQALEERTFQEGA